MKRLISIILIVAIMFTFTPILMNDATALETEVETNRSMDHRTADTSKVEASLSEGSYVILGNNNDIPLLWQVVENDGDKVKLFCSQNILYGVFDAYVGSVTNGNSNWHTSDIRTYLNSDASTVEYKGTLPNYSNLPGFLTCFSEFEKRFILDTTHKSLVHSNSDASDIDGGNVCPLSSYFYNVGLSFDIDMYNNYLYKNTTEKIFLPDLMDLRKIRDDDIPETSIHILYYYDTYSQRHILSESMGNYFTRTPVIWEVFNSWYYYGSYYEAVSYTSPATYSINPYNAEDNLSIRPMCYVDISMERYLSGTGSVKDPYTIVPVRDNLFEMNISNNQVGFYLYDRSTNKPIENVYISAVSRDRETLGKAVEVSTGADGIAAVEMTTGCYDLTITKEGYMTQTITKDVTAGNAYIIAMTPTATTPTIFATEAKYENSYYDILNQKLILHEGSKATLDLTIFAGYMNDCGIKEYWLIQDGEVKFKSGDGVFSGLKASDFSTEHSIYLAAIGDDGVKGSYIKTNLMVQENVLRDNESGTDMKLKIGEEIRFTIDSDIPLIGGQEFSMSLADLPLYIELDGDKFKAGVNLISADTSDGRSGIFKDDTTWNSFKNAVAKKTNPAKYLQQMDGKNLGLKMAQGSDICVGGEGKLGFDVWGYLEGNLANGDVSGTISVTLNASIDREYQQIAFGVPIVITLELSGQLEGTIKALTNVHNFSDLEISGSVAPSVSIAAGAGPGFAGLASLTINGKGTLGAEYTFDKEVGNTFRSYLTASLYLKLKLLFAEWQMDIAEQTFELYDSTGSKNTKHAVSMSDMMEFDNYSIANRSYQASTSDWNNGIRARTSSNQIVPLQTSVYGDTRFQMVQTENTTMLFFLTDDAERSDINRTKLVYSVYDSVLGWSEPIAVEDDGTADFAPFAATDGENIFIAWMDMNAMATEKEDFSQIAARGEIKLAEYHESTGTFAVKKLTDNTVMETLPKLTVVNGIPYVAWVQNTENNMLCNDNSNNLFMYDGNSDSTTEIASAADNVLDLAIAYSNDTPVVACLQDKDGNYTTISDRNLIAFANNQTYNLTQDAMVSGLDHYGEQIIWCQDGKLFGTKNVAAGTSAFNGLEKPISGIYKIIEAKDDIYLVFTGNTLSEEPDQTDTELFAYVFDKEAEAWSDAVQITDLGKTVTDYVGFINQDKELQLVLNSSDISREGEIQETSDIYTVTIDYAPDYELISFDYSDATVGENGLIVPFYADIINNGLTSGSDYSLELCYGNDVVASFHVDEAVRSGNSSVVEGAFVLSNIPQDDAQFAVNVVCDDDKNAANNKKEITLGMEHVMVEITDATVTEDYYLLNINVVNKGLFTANAGINVVIDSVDGEIIAAKRFTLESGETANCLMEINASEMDFDTPAKNVYVFSDTDEANGTLYVVYKPHEHNPTDLPDIEPSCTKSGQTGGSNCPICGEVFTAPHEIAALGHDWDNGVVTTEPTENRTGEKLYTCTRCSETKKETIPPLSHKHSYTTTMVGPTCEDQGYTLHTCSCGDSYKDNYKAALGHAWTTWTVVVQPTGTQEGREERNCNRCDAVESRTLKPVSNPFNDVKESDYYYNPILWAVENGITNGTGKGKFSPENPCTRGQIVTFLWRACGSPEPVEQNNPFSDVSTSAYYYKAVLWAVENGITTGTGKGRFSPEATCTRGQVATFLWRAQGKPAPTSSTNPFNDVNSDAYYYNAILWAVEKGVTNGTSKGKFSPDASCTRGQIVTFLYRALS